MIDKNNIDWFKVEEQWMLKEGISTEELKQKRINEEKLLKAFKSSPSQETFMPLYQSYKPMIYQAAKKNMFGSPIPQSAHMAKAAQSFLDAIRTHKADKAPFSLYAFSTIQNKGKRLNLKYQNIGYIPEARATKYQMFTNAENMLKETLDREPSSHELADEIGWSVKDVETMRKEVKKDLILDENQAEGFSLAKSDKAKQVFQDMMYSLIPVHQVVLEHAVGLNGKDAMVKPSGGPDLTAISKATKLTTPQIRSALRTITRKYKQTAGFGTLAPEIEEGGSY